jgi:hypothetical protein
MGTYPIPGASSCRPQKRALTSLSGEHVYLRSQPTAVLRRAMMDLSRSGNTQGDAKQDQSDEDKGREDCRHQLRQRHIHPIPRMSNR